MHTFHFPHGECMITLEDVTMIFRLRTDGLLCFWAKRPEKAESSWHGSACLAHMHRSLCRALRYDFKDMDGPLASFLAWAWIRMPSIRPLPVGSSFPLVRK
ncbi:hypothetical protein AHAS_Ahas14G0119000 [Arachis hypogaea]